MGGVDDGSGPSSLIYDNVTLCGMTRLGGDSNVGTIFSISADSIVPTLTLTIDSPTTNPVLTGTVIDQGDFTSNIASVKFQLDTVFGNWTPCTTNDGTYDEPNESFTCDLGDPDPGEHTVYVQAEDSVGNRHTIVYDNGTDLLHEFAGGADDGKWPYGSLIQDGDTFYGMTYAGGDLGLGTIFKTQTDGTGFTILHEFVGGADDGSRPYGSLIQDGDTLYGMTGNGGDANLGTIFKIQTDGSGFTLLHEFAGASDGHSPFGSLTQSGNTLYGATSQGGGNSNGGTIFKIQTDGTGFTLLHTFEGGAEDGDNFYYGSLAISDDTLYGATINGGDDDNGTIFSINTNGTGFTLLHEFAGGGNDGQNPNSSVIKDGSTLYGMTRLGGPLNYGTIYKIQTDGTGFTVLYSFGDDIALGSNPYGYLSQSGNTPYGMTQTNDSIFKIQTDGTGFTRLHAFVGGAGDGTNPSYGGNLTFSGTSLYGMTYGGGDSNFGTIFALTASGFESTTFTISPPPASGGGSCLNCHSNTDDDTEPNSPTPSSVGAREEDTAPAQGELPDTPEEADNPKGEPAPETQDAEVAALIDLLVSIGAIPADKVENARALIQTHLAKNTTYSIPATFRFTHYLKEGDTGDEVRMLQRFLNTHGFSVAQTGPGSLGNETDYFGPQTKDAVMRYQGAYPVDILVPMGLTAPTGWFHAASLKKANELLATS